MNVRNRPHPRSRAGNSPNRASLNAGALNSHVVAIRKFVKATLRKSAKRLTDDEGQAIVAEAFETVAAPKRLSKRAAVPALTPAGE